MSAPLPMPWPAPSPVAAAVPDGLRRRRSAAARLTVLPGSGKRDPIAPTARTLLEIELSRFTAWFHGLTGDQFHALRRRAGVDRWMRDTRGFCTSRKDYDKMLGAADQTLGFRTSVWERAQ